jgi:hypothetical protein
VAEITYPGTWYSVSEPAELACRYFDPAEISVPADGSAPTAAITADVLSAAYGDAVAAASDPATWTVATSSEDDVDGVPMTCIAAIAVADTEGVAAGEARFVCLADVGTSGTVTLQTVGTPDGAEFESTATIVGLMTLASRFVPGS